jgi:hypothetical protein
MTESEAWPEVVMHDITRDWWIALIAAAVTGWLAWWLVRGGPEALLWGIIPALAMMALIHAAVAVRIISARRIASPLR